MSDPDPTDPSRYVRLANTALGAVGAFDATGFRVADTEILADFGGSPDRMFAWLIFGSEDEARAASTAAETLEAHARSLFRDPGFPASAVRTLRLGYTSFPEIERGGGRFYFFR